MLFPLLVRCNVHGQTWVERAENLENGVQRICIFACFVRCDELRIIPNCVISGNMMLILKNQLGIGIFFNI